MKSEELWPGRLVRFINKDKANDFLWPNGTLCTVVRVDLPDDVYVKRYDNNEKWLAGLDEFEPYVDPDEVVAGEPLKTVEFDPVNKPKHYQLLPGVEVIDVLDALCDKLDKSSVWKFSAKDASYYAQAMGYLMRCMDKNGKQDIQKAIWYLQRLDSIWEE